MSVKTAVYAVRVTPLLTDEVLFEKALAAVSPERREKAARYRKRADAALSLAAEILLRYAFATAAEPFPAAFEKTVQGKPFAPDSPLHFNLSHSGEWAVCAVSDADIGCDVEKIDPVHVDVAKRFFTAAENVQLDEAENETERTRRFFRLWTLKESFQKATGQGMNLPLSSFSVTLGDTVTVEPPAAVTFAEYTALSGHACAVCARGRAIPPLVTVDVQDLLQNEVRG